jgi:carbon storage regulator
MRRKGETIRIGENVTFTILGISRGQVSVGVTAPRHVVVDREEVHQRRISGQWTRQKPRQPG